MCLKMEKKYVHHTPVLSASDTRESAPFTAWASLHFANIGLTKNRGRAPNAITACIIMSESIIISKCWVEVDGRRLKKTDWCTNGKINMLIRDDMWTKSIQNYSIHGYFYLDFSLSALKWQE